MKFQMLKDLRKEHNLTQQELADLLGISLYSYNHKENGKVAFTTDEINSILTLFNSKYEDVFLP